MTLNTPKQAHEAIERIVHLFNNVHPRQSIGYMTPAEARGASGELDILWKDYWKIRHDRQMPAGEESPMGELHASDQGGYHRKPHASAAEMT